MERAHVELLNCTTKEVELVPFSPAFDYSRATEEFAHHIRNVSPDNEVRFFIAKMVAQVSACWLGAEMRWTISLEGLPGVASVTRSVPSLS